MEVRRVRVNEGLCLRALRLRALADAPTAFAVSLADEQKRPDEYWEDFAREVAVSETTATFVAEEGDRWWGMAGAFMTQNTPDTARLVAMWVDPARRRSGIGAALVHAVVQWARERGARRIQLWVTDTTLQAKLLYARQGFVETKQTKPLPSHPTFQEVLMVRELI
jgi:GNAT superfamily N-acetyltransferase